MSDYIGFGDPQKHIEFRTTKANGEKALDIRQMGTSSSILSRDEALELANWIFQKMNTSYPHITPRYDWERPF